MGRNSLAASCVEHLLVYIRVLQSSLIVKRASESLNYLHPAQECLDPVQFGSNDAFFPRKLSAITYKDLTAIKNEQHFQTDWLLEKMQCSVSRRQRNPVYIYTRACILRSVTFFISLTCLKKEKICSALKVIVFDSGIYGHFCNKKRLATRARQKCSLLDILSCSYFSAFQSQIYRRTCSYEAQKTIIIGSCIYSRQNYARINQIED